MSKKINKKLIRNAIAICLVSSITIIPNFTMSDAYSNIEQEFISVIDKYNQENIYVQNGISLRIGEKLSLPEFLGGSLSNNNTVEIDENGVIRPISNGTVFLSKEIDGVVYVLEIYVPKDNVQANKVAESRSGNYKVFIDPGHGGHDNGAAANGNLEDELNLQISKRVRDKLQSKGINVKMSRTEDVYLSLGERANMANQYGADVFVSIHQNSFTNGDANGIETYYHTDKLEHMPYTREIQTESIKETGANNRGVKSANFAVLRETYMTSALFESGFLTNKLESLNLANPNYQDKLATGIANGIVKYLKSKEDLPVIKTGIVTAESLNVRSGSSQSYPILGSLKKESKVNIVATENSWYKIKFNGGYGYVSSNYIKLDDKVEFTDIKDHWAKSNIEKFILNGYIDGYEDKTFRPNNQITRAEFIKIVNKVFGFNNIGVNKFNDIKPSDWFYNDVCIANKAGYINGYEDKTFKPNNQITREEVSTIITNIKNNKDLHIDKIFKFNDYNDISEWAKTSVEGAIENNYIKGYEDNTIRPKAKITRAESVVMLSRVSK